MDQRTCIKFCVKNEIKCADAFRMLTVAYGEATLDRSNVYRWYKMFSEGREDVNDEERAGRPSTSTTDEKINKVEKMILANRRITVRKVAEDLNISIGSCHSIFINDLGMRRVAAKFVPKLLNCDQKQQRMNIANEMLDSVRDDPNLLQRVITGDEAWVYGYDVETKAQSSQWKLPHEPRPKKARQVRSNVKVLLPVFFDCRGVVHHEFLPQGRTVNKEYYLQVMRNLREVIRQKRPDLWKNKNWLLHHNNASAHTSLLVRDFLAKNNTLMMPQPPYSPDLAPCDFFLFPKLKRPMKGRRYATLDEINTASKDELKKIFKNDFLKCFEDWKKPISRIQLYGFKKRKSLKRSTYKDLDSAMLEWFNQQCASGKPINCLICANQAKFFYQKLGFEGEFSASSGWLTRWKQRYGIREISIQGESLNTDHNAAKEFQTNFKEFITQEDLSPEQIYNADEFGLHCKCLPTQTLAYQNEKQSPGIKMSKERIKILCCGNATGNHKLKLVLIGKSKKPRSFKGTVSILDSLPLKYYSQHSALMDRDIFANWFHQNFVSEVRDYLVTLRLPPKAVLLLDNAPSHPIEEVLKSDYGMIFVKFLPSNVASLIQPMEQGVISCLKRFYRAQLLQRSLEEEMVVATSHNAQSLDVGENVDKDNVVQWLHCDDDDPGFQNLTGEDIVDQILTIEKDPQINKDEEKFTPKTPHSTALAYIEGLLEYLEGEDDSLL
ncbi:JRKL, partial [Cordylochernes scorpioides]